MPELKEYKYKHLLSPTIFSISFNTIKSTMNLLTEYGIEQFITFAFMRRNLILQRNLIEYLVENNVPLVVEKKGKFKLNPIFGASNSVLNKKYNIDIKNLKYKEEKENERSIR